MFYLAVEPSGADAVTGSPPRWCDSLRLPLECEPGGLDLGAWDVLRVRVSNATGVALEDVTVSVDGPFTVDGKRSRITTLDAGTTARYSFNVNASESGRHVPVHVRTTYGYRDLGAEIRTRTQDGNLDVVVRAIEPRRDPTPVERTVLYLAASPRDMPALRSDLEMRKVKEKLQLSRQREQYRTVTPRGLAELFGQHRSTIRCVVVNACHSIHLAEILATQIDHTIGMRYQIGDEAAIQFSVGFYQALFAGWPVPDAFARGRAYILSRPALEQHHQTPLLFPPGP